ncbi:MAG: ATP-binding protein [Phycisphaerae bacterium]|nr:ATP-binding protein [Saprospiraceae bacterium]
MSHANSPFKFLDSYQQEDADIFFGREKETDALYNALSGVKHLLVYGPSGAGKTSLIECGLRNQFSDADWFAVSIRRGNNMTASVFARINEALQGKIDLDPKTKLPKNPDFDFGEAIENLFSERSQPVYLLFDQFEELLILGDEAEKKDFFTRLNRLIRYKVPCRVMLVMREEFIGHLSEFEPLCPSIFQHRFRLEKMGRSNVQSVIQQILEAEKYQSDFRAEQPAALAKTILAKLPDTQREIELAHVQVFLGELWDRAAPQKGELPVLHSGLVQENDNLERVLDSFLKKQMEQLEQSHGEKVPLELLAAMISERHTKLQLSAGDLENALTKNAVVLQKPLPDLLRDLEQRRIIRTLKSGEQTQFEISHDVLALVVGQNLTDEMKLREKAREIYRVYEGRSGMFSREDLDYLRAFEGYLGYSEGLGRRISESEKHILAIQKQELEKALAARRRARLVAAGGFLLAVIALVAAVFAVSQTREAEKQRIEVQSQRNIAQQRLDQFLIAEAESKKLKVNEMIDRAKTDFKAGYKVDALKTLNEILQLDTSKTTQTLVSELKNEFGQ